MDHSHLSSEAPSIRYLPIPTTLSSRIRLNGTPNNHMITDDMLSPSIR